MDDLIKPFRAFRYYALGQNGSASIKSVLPALTGRTYDTLPIREGTTASLVFQQARFAGAPDAEHRRVRSRQLGWMPVE